MMRRLVCVCVCGLAFASPAAADPLTLTAVGRLSEVFSPEAKRVLGLTASAGDPFTVNVVSTSASNADFEANVFLTVGGTSFAGGGPGFVNLLVAEDMVEIFVGPMPVRTGDPPDVTGGFRFSSNSGDPGNNILDGEERTAYCL
jgi:hypothetical protein